MVIWNIPVLSGTYIQTKYSRGQSWSDWAGPDPTITPRLLAEGSRKTYIPEDKLVCKIILVENCFVRIFPKTKLV